MSRVPDPAAFHRRLDALALPGPAGTEVVRRGLARDRSADLLRRLGDPQDRAPAIHVVGTAGKGMTAALLTGALVRGGHRTVTHLSPHVDDVRERFLLDGRLAPWPAVLDAAGAVFAAVDEMADEPEGPPTFFAVTLALAVELGARAGVDRQVIEAGIGGRLDATNVLGRPDTRTVLTAVGIDHTDVLGATVESIATEKLAVLAGRRRLVVGPQPVSARAGVRAAVAGLDDPTGLTGPNGPTDPTGPTVPIGLEVVWVEPRDGPEAADMAVDRAALSFDPADPADPVEAATRTVVAVLDDAEHRALTELDAPVVDLADLPPGRGEIIDIAERHGTALGVELVLDGAHNPMKVAALVDRLHRDGVPVAAVVLAVGKGKDLDGIVRELAALRSITARSADGGSAGNDGPVVVPETFATDPGGPDGLAGPAGRSLADVRSALGRAGLRIFDPDARFAPGANTPRSDADAAAIGLMRLLDQVMDRIPVDARIVVTGSFRHLAAWRAAAARPGPDAAR